MAATCVGMMVLCRKSSVFAPVVAVIGLASALLILTLDNIFYQE